MNDRLTQRDLEGIRREAERLCPLGKPGAHYSCMYCNPYVWLHQGSSDCGCSTERRTIMYSGTLCHHHAGLLDTLHADTPLGKMHRRLVSAAEMRYMRGSDD